MTDFDMIRELKRNDERLRLTEVKEVPLTNFGSVFPSNWPNNTPFFRTDLGWWCYYDGTRWLTAHELATPVSYLTSFAGTPSSSAVQALRTDYAPWFTRVVILTNVTAPNSGAAFWTVTLQGLSIASVATNIYQITTAADVAGTRTNHEGNANMTPANRALLRVLMTSTGAPGNIELTATAFYRLIVP